MNSWASFRERISSELTPRLRFALVALLSIFAYLAVSALADDAERRSLDVQQLRLELKSLTGRAKEVDWNARASLALKAREAWQKTKWEGKTAGIAAAEIQSALTSMTAYASVQSPKIQVSSDAVELNGRPSLRFEINGVSESRSLFLLLGSVATHPKTLLVTEISAALPAGQAGRIQIAGYAPYVAPAQATPSAPAKSAPQ